MSPKNNIRLKKMVSIGTPALDGDQPMIYLTPAQAAAMEALKEALVRPVDDPRRLGNMHDALYTLTHGDNAMTEDAVQKEVETFLAAREQEAQARAKKLAETFAEMTQKPQASPTPAVQGNKAIKPGRGPRPFYY